MNILIFTSLYPNAGQPNLGIFVENRIIRVVQKRNIRASVVAPIPWVPFRSRFLGRYARYAVAPEREYRFGIPVLHPRYPVIPRVGMELSPFLMYAFVRPYIQRCVQSGQTFDLIDSHYFYPDGVAAALLAKFFHKPFVVTARGTDINLISTYRRARQMMLRAANDASAIVAVSQALKDRMVEIGMNSSTIKVIRNGVDLDLFRVLDKEEARTRFGVSGPVLLSAGNLVPEKGHNLAIRCLRILTDATLLIAGEGENESALRKLAGSLGVSSRVRFLGSIRHVEMRDVYNAADVLVLASEREGWPNVLLESMACGTPVVATRVGGISEIVTCRPAGILSERSPERLASAMRDLLTNPPDRNLTRRHAERFSWDEVVKGQVALWRRTLRHRA